MAKPEEERTHVFSRSFLPTGMLLRGKYRIDGVIGAGGMAVVYAATHRNRKRFAVKVLHPELSTRRDVRARFVREGYLANSVEHPGVVSVLDDDVTEDGSAFLVMELLEGATVEGLGPRDRPLPLRESLAIVIDVLDVLATAHLKSVIHRDIKPANLFVTRQGQVKLLDFGIARLADVTLGVKATGTGATLGTPAFMAPEQALGGEIDARTDLWAVGATVFTMLSGCRVHPGANARQVMVRAATDPARSLASVAPEVPAAVDEWVGKALAFDKTARWESAAAMRDAGLRIHAGLFGEGAERCAKRLFELRAEEFATSATEQLPDGALHTAVRETAHTTLESQPGCVVANPSLPARRPGSTAQPVPRRQLRWTLLVGAGAALTLGALILAFSRGSRRPDSSLSAARPSVLRPASLSSAIAAASPVEGSVTGTGTGAGSAAAPFIDSSAGSRRPSSEAVRAAAPVTPARVRAPGTLASRSKPPAVPAIAPEHAASAALPRRNPLQLDLQ